MNHVFFAFFLLVLCPAANSSTVVTVAASPTHQDGQRYWNNILLELALEKTKAEFGSYRIEKREAMSDARVWANLKSNKYPNYFHSFPYDPNHTHHDIRHVPFPVELGLLGYRACFYPAKKKHQIDQLLADGNYEQLLYGLGRNWADVKILRHNGLSVLESTRYENLFKMTAAGRFDLFCRGVTELKQEFQRFKSVGGLNIEPKHAFFYSFPIFYYFNVKSSAVSKRIEKGFLIAYKDGSLMKAFTKYYGDSIAFSDLANRKIIPLSNPLVAGLSKGYEQYFYQP